MDGKKKKKNKKKNRKEKEKEKKRLGEHQDEGVEATMRPMIFSPIPRLWSRGGKEGG